MSRKYLQTKATSLSYSISDAETNIRLDFLEKLNGDSISASDIGDIMYFTIDPGTSKEEICSTTSSDVTVNADGTVDMVIVRGLQEIDPYTTGGFASDHGTGAVVVFSNNPQLYAQFANKANDNTYTGQNVFNGYAPQTNTDPVSGNDLTRLSYVQALVLGTLTSIDVVVPGIAGETIVDGNLIYLNTDNKWYKCDADTASTVNNVLLGIAKGAGTLNNQITNGILLQGLDNAQSGLVAGEVQFASNTAGGISNTPGTTEVTVGVAKSTTELYFAPRFNQQITEDQQDAMAGTSGTPSASNKFVTNDDTSGTGSIIRSSIISNRFGGTGADGALTISSGTTTLDLAGSALFIKNYTSISITGTGKLAFSNPHANGTTIVLKSQGDVTLTSSQTPMVDASGLGAIGGTGLTAASGNTNGQAGTAGISTLLTTGGGALGAFNAVGAGGSLASAVFGAFTFSTTRQKYTLLPVASGGGSAGVSISSGTGSTGNGGRGGGTLVMECAGAFNFTTASGISVAGGTGGNGSVTATGNAGGSGGGAGGFCLVLYNTLTANTGTVTTTGGVGGNNDATTPGGTKYGAGGGALITAGSAGTSSVTGGVKTGGNGADGVATIIQNNDFI